MSYANLNRRHKVGLFLVLVAAGISLFLEASAKQTTGMILLGLAGTWLLGSLRLRSLWLVFSILACIVGLTIAAIPVIDQKDSLPWSWQSYDAAVSDLGLEIVAAKEWTPVSEVPAGSRSASAKMDPIPDQPTVNYDPGAKKWKPVAPTTITPDSAPTKSTERGPWEKYAKKQTDEKKLAQGQYSAADIDVTVQIPATTQRWERPDLPSPVTMISFPRNVDEKEIISSIQSQLLQPRAKFSVWASLGTNLSYSVTGSSLFVAGLFSLGWCIRSGGDQNKSMHRRGVVFRDKTSGPWF